jgi:hypothetical protein
MPPATRTSRFPICLPILKQNSRQWDTDAHSDVQLNNTQVIRATALFKKKARYLWCVITNRFQHTANGRSDETVSTYTFYVRHFAHCLRVLRGAGKRASRRLLGSGCGRLRGPQGQDDLRLKARRQLRWQQLAEGIPDDSSRVVGRARR